MRFWSLLLLASLLVVPAYADPLDREVLAAAPVSTSASAGLATIHKVLGLAKAEYRLRVPPATLIGGAFKGMSACLADRHQDTRLTQVTIPPTVAMLDQRWQAILRHEPAVSSAELSAAAIRGMLATLQDPYTVYMDRQEYAALMEQMDGGNFGGLGIYVEQDERHGHRLTIEEPMEDSPASQAGLQPGDVILKIDGTDTVHMNLVDASKRLRGPEGSAVTLTIERGELAPFDVPMKRAKIVMKTVTHKIIHGDIGYARIRIFGESTGDELESAMQDFDTQHVQGYIVDLRNNGGGYINTALEVCSKFLPTGSRVVSVVERGQPEAIYSSLPNVRPSHPLLVLVNKYSASASEITAGAMQDLHAGTLLGTRTFGKGSVQKIFPLDDGTAVKITTAHYHTPAGKDIHKVGIQPDVLLDMDPHDVDTDKDKQLDQAVTDLEASLAKLPHGPAPLQTVSVAGLGEVVPIHDPSQEYEYIAAHPREKDGAAYLIVSQKTITVDGHYYDNVTARGPDGDEKTFIFDLSPAMGDDSKAAR